MKYHSLHTSCENLSRKIYLRREKLLVCIVFTGKEWSLTAYIELGFESFKVSSWYDVTIISFHFSELLILSVQVLACFPETRKQLQCQYNSKALHYSVSPVSASQRNRDIWLFNRWEYQWNDIKNQSHLKQRRSEQWLRRFGYLVLMSLHCTCRFRRFYFSV